MQNKKKYEESIIGLKSEKLCTWKKIGHMKKV